MAYVQRQFIPDIQPALVVPAHFDNVRPGDNHPKVNVYHTPEERADNIEVTPYYFANQIWRQINGTWVQIRASTHYYASGGLGTVGNGDLYQMVPERYGAIANGVTSGMPYPADTNPSISLNLQSRSIEIEGFAHSITQTMPRYSKQWWTVVEFAVFGYYLHEIPLDREHNIGHYEVSNQRTDPGDLNIDEILEDAVRLIRRIEKMEADIENLELKHVLQQSWMNEHQEEAEHSNLVTSLYRGAYGEHASHTPGGTHNPWTPGTEHAEIEKRLGDLEDGAHTDAEVSVPTQ